ncbi:MAG TPA: hypothetical protein VE093_19985 [Polyangiaceae bacterium]|nr:hypothetical protein [Polyangiaceae bacterium]
MPEIRLSCPTCSQRLSASTDALRTRMSCPRCGAEFLPMDVIPPQLTLPAMPVVSPTPPPAPVQVVEPLFETPAPASASAAVPASASAAVPASAPVPAPVAAPFPAAVAAPFPAAAAAPFPAAAAAPFATPADGPASGLEPPPTAPASPFILPPAQAPAGAPKAAPAGSPTAEIASFAADLQHTARRRAPWPVGYEHVAGLCAISAGLALLALALIDSTPIRVVLGVVATLFLAVALASAALFALARRGSTSTQAKTPSPGPILSSLTGRARGVLVAGAAVAFAVSATATGILASATGGEPERAPARVASVQQAPAAPSVTPEKREIPPEQRADYKLKRDGRSPVGGGVLTVSPSFRSDDGAFDLIMHFHGNTQLVEESVGAAKLNALVYVVNLGTGSGVYEDRYTQPAIFDDALTRIRETAEKRGLQNAKIRRIALTSWSAGYGAISKILEPKKNLERIDALLMLDGLHVAYMDTKTRAGIDKVRLGPFIRFAKEAAEGKKLFSITHGDTETQGYATTGEAADALLREIGAARTPASGSPPKVAFPAVAGVVPKHAERWLDQTTEARAGGMRVRGYVGKSPEHHMAHLIQMSVTVLPDLAERWQ